LICQTFLFTLYKNFKGKMKVALVYNEPNPEIYKSVKKKGKKELGFKPIFDLEGNDPIYEYDTIAAALRKYGYEVYTLNIMDDLHVFIKDYDKNKPDVVFNFVELYKEQPRLEMNFTGLMELL
jgi:D-alanine-D-alanine ligase